MSDAATFRTCPRVPSHFALELIAAIVALDAAHAPPGIQAGTDTTTPDPKPPATTPPPPVKDDGPRVELQREIESDIRQHNKKRRDRAINRADAGRSMVANRFGPGSVDFEQTDLEDVIDVYVDSIADILIAARIHTTTPTHRIMDTAMMHANEELQMAGYKPGS